MKNLVLILMLSTFFTTSCGRQVVVSPSSRIVVTQLPKDYKIVRVKGIRYYYFNGRHYRKTRSGYVVVRV